MESGHADGGSGVGAGHADAGIRERWVTRTFESQHSGAVEMALAARRARRTASSEMREVMRWSGPY